jgi:hypothetical protein
MKLEGNEKGKRKRKRKRKERKKRVRKEKKKRKGKKKKKKGREKEKKKEKKKARKKKEKKKEKKRKRRKKRKLLCPRCINCKLHICLGRTQSQGATNKQESTVHMPLALSRCSPANPSNTFDNKAQPAPTPVQHSTPQPHITNLPTHSKQLRFATS